MLSRSYGNSPNPLLRTAGIRPPGHRQERRTLTGEHNPIRFLKKEGGENFVRNKKRRSQQGKAAILGLAVILVAAAGIYYVSRPSAGPARTSQASPAEYPRRETRPTLSPAMFTGEVAETYQVAQEIPEVLDQLYCYCKCRENFGHKSLLTCYVDRHAST